MMRWAHEGGGGGGSNAAASLGCVAAETALGSRAPCMHGMAKVRSVAAEGLLLRSAGCWAH